MICMLSVLTFFLATALSPVSQAAVSINSPDAFMALFPKSAKEVDLRNVWKQLGIAPGKFTVFCNDCLGAVAKSNLSSDLVAVQLWEYNGPARIVFFRRSRNGWVDPGIVDIPVERLEPVEVKLGLLQHDVAKSVDLAHSLSAKPRTIGRNFSQRDEMIGFGSGQESAQGSPI
jgi:hypothetical protein